jgi:splicing factor 3B subunit 3
LYRKVEHEDRECPIPIRNSQVEGKGLFFTAHTMLRVKDVFFFLIISEYGDLYKVSLEVTNTSVHGISV